MPNHFHLIVYERRPSGISHFMQRVLNSYTKYFNQKYRERGHLFSGPFRAIAVGDEAELGQLSAHIHLNPRSLPGWKGREREYPWSSFRDILGTNRFGKLLVADPLLKIFGTENKYKVFVDNFAKEKVPPPPLSKHLIEETVTSFV